MTQTLQKEPENLTYNNNLIWFRREQDYTIKVNMKTSKYQYFWFISAFLDTNQKLSPSIRGKPELLIQNKTNITNMLGC